MFGLKIRQCKFFDKFHVWVWIWGTPPSKGMFFKIFGYNKGLTLPSLLTVSLICWLIGHLDDLWHLIALGSLYL